MDITSYIFSRKYTDRKTAALTEELVKQPTSKPRVYIDGVIPTTKDDVLAELTYECGAERWHAYIKIKCQGNSSLGYPKKNFTVKLYEDEARTIKKMVTFGLFGQPSYKFVLKANWVDHTHARNVVAARLWGEVVASRPDYDTLPAELRNSPNNGAINGFPIIVYTNGSYQGLYTWNVGKDEWMWGMNENNSNHALIAGCTNTWSNAISKNATNFRKLWDGTTEDWEFEIGENKEGIVESFNRLISCLMNTTDLECKAQLDNHLDVQAAIDYDLTACLIAGTDSMARNVLMQTYDLVRWRPGMYDLDDAFNRTGYVSADHPHCKGSNIYGERNSLLWERIEKLYAARLKERGKALRKNVFSYGNIMSHFESFIGSIGKETYADDLIPYPTISPGTAEPIWQFRNWVRDRLAYFDSWLDGLTEYVFCTDLTLDKGTLTFTSFDTQTLTATIAPTDCNDVVQWATSDPSIVIVEGGVVTPVTNGNAVVTATCSGITVSCAVTITGLEIEDRPLYNLTAPVTIASDDDIIDTGVNLLHEDMTFTVALDFEMGEVDSNAQRHVFLNPTQSNFIQRRTFGLTATGYHQLLLYDHVESEFVDKKYDTKKINAYFESGRRYAVVYRRNCGSNEVTVTVGKSDWTWPHETLNARLDRMIMEGSTANAHIGGWLTYSGNGVWAKSSHFPGTIHRAKIYNRRLTDDEVTAFVAGLNE